MMLVATQSFSYTDPFDGEKKAIHRGKSRVVDGHELARRFPHRFEPVNTRETAQAFFRDDLDRATTYDEYVRILDAAERNLEQVERGGMYRCGGQSVTDHFID